MCVLLTKKMVMRMQLAKSLCDFGLMIEMLKWAEKKEQEWWEGKPCTRTSERQALAAEWALDAQAPGRSADALLRSSSHRPRVRASTQSGPAWPRRALARWTWALLLGQASQPAIVWRELA